MEKESEIRRPLLLLAGSVWLIYLICLLKMSVMLVFFVLLFIVIRSRNLALLCLFCTLPLLIALNEPLTQVMGIAQVTQSRFMEDKKCDVIIEGKKYLYEGALIKSGLYEVKASIDAFNFKRTITGFQEHAYYRSLGYSGRIELQESRFLRAGARTWRFALQSAAYRSVEGYGEQREFAFAFLFGGTQVLDPLYVQLFKQVGILHLLVVSGMHLKIYAEFLRAVLRRLMCPRWAQMAILWTVFLFLCLVTDFHVSCLRSFLLVLLRDLLFLFRKQIDEIEQLSLVSLLLLIMNPYYGVTLSFILGTLAHASLLFTRRPSVAVLYICLLPFQVMFQAEVSILYLMFNIGLAMVMDMLLPIMLISLLMRFIQPVIRLCLSGLLLILDTLRQIDLFKFKVMLLHPYSMTLVIIMLYVFINSAQSEALYLKWLKVRVLALVLLISGLFFVQFLQFNIWNRGVHFLDVGQGDASIIITEHGRKILIDTGNHPDLQHYMRYLGVERFDCVFITHRDADHSGKLSEIAFDKLYTSKFTALSGAVLLKGGDHLVLDEVDIKVLSPQQQWGEENADSLVLLITVLGRTYLYGGDATAAQMENRWFDQVDVFKFPHHGANSSLQPESFTQKSVPWIILSYGRNHYGHPSPQVLAYFGAQSVHHTYSQGSIQFKKNGVITY